MLEPSHEEPPPHEVHDDRVFVSPPLVAEPGAQVSQDVAPVDDAYLLSLRQLTHCIPSLLEYLPRRHSVMRLDPSHEDPGSHLEHVVLIASALPEVKNPGGQVEHSLDPAALYF